MPETRDIPLTDIRETRLLLRLVNKESLEYMELKDSIAAHGVLNSICVRAVPPPGTFEVADGMRRYAASVDLGLPTIPCTIQELTDEQVLTMQIQANSIRLETQPIEYARHIKQLMNLNPTLTVARLHGLIHKSPKWIHDQLGLLRLLPEIRKMVDRGEIPLNSAYLLSRVFWKQQKDFVDLAKVAAFEKFKAEVIPIIKEQREGCRQGRLDRLFAEDFKPNPYLRSLKDILRERDDPVAAPILLSNAKTALNGWNACLTWIISLDKKSVAEQRAKFLRRAKKTFKKEASDVIES
jgi:ParB/RepB/Spo0J family partition protein